MCFLAATKIVHNFNVSIMDETKLVLTPKGRTRSLYNSYLISIDLKINKISCYIFDITHMDIYVMRKSLDWI